MKNVVHLEYMNIVNGEFKSNPKMAHKPAANNPWRKRFLPSGLVGPKHENPKSLQLEDVKDLLLVSIKELSSTKIDLESTT